MSDLPLLPVGRTASVRVPATSANLGPGFDSLGLALDWYDDYFVEVTPSGLAFDLTGPGSSTLPRDDSHLIIHTLKGALAKFGFQAPGLFFRSELSIPLARGLGSSSAAVVAGLGLAWALARPGVPIDRQATFEAAYKIEGHGDNVGPAVLGGFTITWPSSAPGMNGLPESRTSLVRDDVRALALIPSEELLTDSARGALPAEVPLSDAIANVARSALLVHAMADDPGLLLEATADRLHQDYRKSLAPASHALMSALREQGFAALVSGAGPTVLVLHHESDSPALTRAVQSLPEAEGFQVRMVRPGRGLELL